MCIFLIKDTNCNTVCTSPEGGMDIQIKTLHRCMNEYNSSLQYVKGGQYKLLTKVKCCNMCFCTRREEDIIASCYFSNHNFCYSKLISWFSSIFHENHWGREAFYFLKLFIPQKVRKVLFPLFIARKIMKEVLLRFYFIDMAIQIGNEASLKEIRDGLITKNIFLVGITCILREWYHFLFKYYGSLTDGPWILM